LGASALRPESLAALSSLRLDFALRCLAPLIIIPSFVLFASNSHHNSGAVAQIVSNPPSVLTAVELPKFRDLAGREDLF
jgi:hypothetical protein